MQTVRAGTGRRGNRRDPHPNPRNQTNPSQDPSHPRNRRGTGPTRKTKSNPQKKGHGNPMGEAIMGLKIRAGEPQESFVRAVYAEMLLDKAETMISQVNPTMLEIGDIESASGESVSPSAWNLRCFQDSFEEEYIRQDLFQRLSAEAKEVLAIFWNTPAEVTEILLDICVAGERGNPRKYCKRMSIQYIYKPARVKNYLRRFRNFSRQKIERIFSELHRFFKESIG